MYEGLRFEEGFRPDIIVGGKVILELKSVVQIDKVHTKQVLTYLELKGLQLGFVLDFGANLMRELHFSVTGPALESRDVLGI